MTQLSNIRFKADNSYPISYNNRYTPPMPQGNSLDDVFMMQALEKQKAAKKEKSKERWYKTGVLAQVGLAVAFGVMAAGTVISLVKQGGGSSRLAERRQRSVRDFAQLGYLDAGGLRTRRRGKARKHT